MGEMETRGGKEAKCGRRSLGTVRACTIDGCACATKTRFHLRKPGRIRAKE